MLAIGDAALQDIDTSFVFDALLLKTTADLARLVQMLFGC